MRDFREAAGIQGIFASKGAGHVLAKMLVHLIDADVFPEGAVVFPAPEFSRGLIQLSGIFAEGGIRKACGTYPQDIFTAGCTAWENHTVPGFLRWRKLENTRKKEQK